jgi:hypothetical protein
MVAAPILVAVIMLTQRSDIYYGNAENFCPHLMRISLDHFLFPKLGN